MYQLVTSAGFMAGLAVLIIFQMGMILSVLIGWYSDDKRTSRKSRSRRRPVPIVYRAAVPDEIINRAVRECQAMKRDGVRVTLDHFVILLRTHAAIYNQHLPA